MSVLFRFPAAIPLLGILMTVATPLPVQSEARMEPPPSPGAAHSSPATGESSDFRAISEAGHFALTFPDSDWIRVAPGSDPESSEFSLVVRHRSGGAWVKGHVARRSNRGVEGSLMQEASHAKYLIDYEPDSVQAEISPDSYRASALYCGRLRQGKARPACSRVLVKLHGRRMVQLHSLVDATTPHKRDRLQSQVEEVFASLELLQSGPPN